MRDWQGVFRTGPILSPTFLLRLFLWLASWLIFCLFVVRLSLWEEEIKAWASHVGIIFNIGLVVVLNHGDDTIEVLAV